MPSLDVAYASAIQAAYTIGLRDGVSVALDHLPAYAQEAVLQAMIADHSERKAELADKPGTVEEIAALQARIAHAIEIAEGAKN